MNGHVQWGCPDRGGCSAAPDTDAAPVITAPLLQTKAEFRALFVRFKAVAKGLPPAAQVLTPQHSWQPSRQQPYLRLGISETLPLTAAESTVIAGNRLAATH